MHNTIQNLFEEWCKSLVDEDNTYAENHQALFNAENKTKFQKFIGNSLNELVHYISEKPSSLQYIKQCEAFFNLFNTLYNAPVIFKYFDFLQSHQEAKFQKDNLNQLTKIYDSLENIHDDCSHDAKRDILTAIHAIGRVITDLDFYNSDKRAQKDTAHKNERGLRCCFLYESEILHNGKKYIKRASPKKQFIYEKKYSNHLLKKKDIYQLIAYNLQVSIREICDIYHTQNTYELAKDIIDSISQEKFSFTASKQTKSFSKIRYVIIKVNEYSLEYPNLKKEEKNLIFLQKKVLINHSRNITDTPLILSLKTYLS
jgi:hypothetical protein